MKRSIYAVISLMMAMVVGFTACGDDDKGFSAEQIAYFEKNLEFIREKKVLKGDDGELLYKQVVLGGDTALYRVLGYEPDELPTALLRDIDLVPVTGLEPVQYCYREILSLLCLPFHHTGSSSAKNRIPYIRGRVKDKIQKS